MARKACKNCKRIYEGDMCPECKSQEYVNDFKGRVIIFDPEKSEVAKNMKITKNGEYAIKVR